MGSSAGADDWNPYAPPSDAFGQRLQDAAFGVPAADRVLQDWLAAHPELATDQQTLGYDQLCNDYNTLTWFKIRVSACTEFFRLKNAAANASDDYALAFADQPPVRAIGTAKVPLTWNPFGCQSADVSVNGVKAPLFVDTGAQVSIIRAGLAERMQIRVLADKIGIGTTTADVAGHAGIIDRLQIGTAIAENVPVLILPDAQLKVPGVGQIDGLLGLQVFVAFGRIAWIDGGRNLALGQSAPRARATAPRIYWHHEGLGVPLATDRGVMGAHLDTGANTSFWRQSGLALLDPSLLATAQEKAGRVGGMGGIVEQKQRVVPAVSFRLGPARVSLRNVRVWGPGPISAARIGMDAVSQFGTFILDFEQMRVDGRLKTTAERKAMH